MSQGQSGNARSLLFSLASAEPNHSSADQQFQKVAQAVHGDASLRLELGSAASNREDNGSNDGGGGFCLALDSGKWAISRSFPETPFLSLGISVTMISFVGTVCFVALAIFSKVNRDMEAQKRGKKKSETKHLLRPWRPWSKIPLALYVVRPLLIPLAANPYLLFYFLSGK
jgi:hypothetical protein